MPRVVDRFFKYVSYDTQSDPNSKTVPTAMKEKILGAELAKELAEIGLESAKMDEFGYVYGWLPASTGCEDLEPIGLIAHMDTAPSTTGANVKPRIVHYEGGDIELGNGVVTGADYFDYLPKYIGQDLIVTDGTTLLGADDKAGVAEIFTAMEYLIEHPEIKHGKICVCITPDEEVGQGAEYFNIKEFGAAYAYTIDAGPLGELEYENFNAVKVDIVVTGVFVHPGMAKNKLKNAILIANELISMLPAAEAPAHTENYEGYYHVSNISGNESSVKITMNVREFSKEKFERMKQFMLNLAAYLNGVYGEGTVSIEMEDQFYNMKEKILPVMHIVERAEQAFHACDVEPNIIPARGGTDGARLSYEGLPCPNLSAGEKYAHGVHEFISIQSMEKMVEVLIALSEKQSSM